MTDERGRVPLALVGVALLVASAGVAGHLSLAGPQATTPDTDQAAREATVLARLAVADGASRAARAAARHPVVMPAGEYGRALRPGHAFRDALRLRIYAATRATLADATARRNDVTATVSVPAVDSPAAARTAIDAVRLTRRPTGGLNVTVRNLTLTLRHDGRVVDRDTRTVTVTVHSPVLALHERVDRYATRLENDPLDGPGLGRQLTARLTVVGWGRGWAQYHGAPIANVLATRHVAVTTNAAVLGVQRDVFSQSDPVAAAAYRRNAVETGVEDLVGAAASSGPPGAPRPPTTTGETLLGNDQRVRVGVNATADRAYLAVTGDSLADILHETYRGRIRVQTAATRLSTTRVNTTTASTSVSPAASGPGVATPPGFTRLATHHRRVRTVTSVGNTTVATTHRITVAVVGRVAAAGNAPDRPLVATPTPLLRDAASGVVRARGGLDALAKRAVDGELRRDGTTVSLAIPPAVRARAIESVTSLRDRLGRDLSLSVDAGRGFGGRPRRRLARELAEHHDAFVDAPARYDTLGTRATIAARVAYLDAVEHRLRERTGGFAAARRTVADRTGQPLATARTRPTPVDASPADSPVLSVRGTPAYLSATRVDGRYPLATRNVNLFTVPYGDAGSALADAVVPDPPAAVSLASAVATLRALDGVEGNSTVRRRRATLRSAVGDATNRLRTPLSATLARETTLSARERRAAVDAAFSHYAETTSRAAAAVNGSLATRLSLAAERRGASAQHGRLGVSLRVALRNARRTHGRVANAHVADARRAAQGVFGAMLTEGASRVGDAAKQTAARRVADAGERVLGRRLDDATKRKLARQRLAQLPAGLPVAPIPGYWYATANVWVVSVRGGYERFTATARSQTPGPDSLTYVRQNATVGFDVDGDGRRERVGRNTPIRFSVSTAVVVVVPPGPRGVGDTDGDADEQSAGW